MKANKGFTLIELLAVIVVLAIIALIATPVVLSAIGTARDGADKESARGYIKAVEFACAQRLLTNQTSTWAQAVAEADFKGTTPTEAGTWLLDGNCLASSAAGTMNGFTAAELGL